MPENRYFLDQKIDQGDTVTLPKEEQKHLRVMRKEPGDTIELVNGKNLLAQATLLTPETAQVTSITTQDPPKRQIILAQALLRPKNLDLVIEKGTELGATAFWLFPGEKSEKKELSENQKNRLTHLTISALKQCGRLDLPTIVEKPPLTEWDPPSLPLLYGSLTSQNTLSKPGSVIFAVGPESGFMQNELKILEKLGARDITLNPNTLRAETAALCALSKLI